MPVNAEYVQCYTGWHEVLPQTSCPECGDHGPWWLALVCGRLTSCACSLPRGRWRFCSFRALVGSLCPTRWILLAGQGEGKEEDFGCCCALFFIRCGPGRLPVTVESLGGCGVSDMPLSVS